MGIIVTQNDPGAQGDIMKQLFLPIIVLGLLAGCKTEHTVHTDNTIKSEGVIKTEHTVNFAPIHITLDINLKVDKALDDFFSDLD